MTEELNNIRKFESVGFSHEQAETLTDVIEDAITSSHQDLKEFIRSEINVLRREFKFDLKDLEARIMASQKDMLIKIFGIVFGTVGLAVTILKLFP